MAPATRVDLGPDSVGRAGKVVSVGRAGKVVPVDSGLGVQAGRDPG
jgi:hypothetical protein